jgi:hypothetical protein
MQPFDLGFEEQWAKTNLFPLKFTQSMMFVSLATENRLRQGILIISLLLTLRINDYPQTCNAIPLSADQEVSLSIPAVLIHQ